MTFYLITYLIGLFMGLLIYHLRMEYLKARHEEKFHPQPSITTEVDT